MFIDRWVSSSLSSRGSFFERSFSDLTFVTKVSISINLEMISLSIKILNPTISIMAANKRKK